MNSISDKIVQGRKAKRINQKDFAQLIGVSQPSLIKFERGETDLIPLGVARKISSELDIPFNELFEIESKHLQLKNFTEQIDDLETKLQKLNKESKKNEELATLRKEKYKDLYLEKIEREFTEYMELLFEIYESIETFDSREQKIKFEKQLQSEKEYLSDTISTLFREEIFSEFEILEILYQNDPKLALIIGDKEGDPKELANYWSEYMDISPSKVEQFLVWYNKKWDKKLKWSRARLLATERLRNKDSFEK
ncbi:helix-turn-helix domain-containing protein [Draconibacterium halophilum]|uniref:Helix-turn-helix transcriptional regulator n=1 Tax=Draconibacterium halophilum TaxID=2706887 RepID=A0A6C0R9Q5_9BACT|nr:helix-turn-helix transcriptional regulator [Draconibacterium halophilum]QIA06425.1 helix-turn-helix transcriptional regulator [Draconibacterium halophilum]